MSLAGIWEKAVKLKYHPALQSDIPFSKEGAHRQLPWIIAVMTTIGVLVLAIGLSINTTASNTSSHLERRYQVHIPFDEGKEKTLAKEILASLSKMDAVDSANTVSRSEQSRLLENWLGESSETELLPFPAVILFSIKENTDIKRAEAKVRQTLKKYPNVVLDHYHEAVSELQEITHIIRYTVITIGIAITIATLTMVVLITRTSFDLHFPIVRLLHRTGAEDHYIARQFQLNAFLLSCKGVILGALLAWLLMLLLGNSLMSSEVMQQVAPASLTSSSYVALWLPLLILLSVAMCTYMSVRHTLSRLH